MVISVFDGEKNVFDKNILSLYWSLGIFVEYF